MGRLSEALPFAEKSLALRVSQFGFDHPGLASAECQLALTLGRLKRHNEAVAILEGTLARLDVSGRIATPMHANVLRHMGSAYARRGGDGDSQRAIATLQRSVLEFSQSGSAHMKRMQSALRALANEVVRTGGSAGLRELFERIAAEAQLSSHECAIASFMRVTLVRKLVEVSSGLGDDDALVRQLRQDVTEIRACESGSPLAPFEAMLALAELLNSSTDPARRDEARSIAQSVERESALALGDESETVRAASALLKKLAGTK